MENLHTQAKPKQMKKKKGIAKLIGISSENYITLYALAKEVADTSG